MKNVVAICLLVGHGGGPGGQTTLDGAVRELLPVVDGVRVGARRQQGRDPLRVPGAVAPALGARVASPSQYVRMFFLPT